MGKNKIIKSLGSVIGNIVVHRILIKYTNKPESVNYLRYEVQEYGDVAIEKAQEFNWNSQDKERIKFEALKKFKKEIEKYYKDVKFPMKEAEKLIEETIDEIIQ